VKDGSPRVLVVRLSAIGDCLHALPALAALRQAHPQAMLGWAIEEAAHELLQGHPMVDRFHVFPRRAFKRRTGSVVERLRMLNAFRRELRAVRYDIALDFQGLTKSGLVSWWSNAPKRIAFAGAESRELNRFFANVRVSIPGEAVHVVDKNLALLKPLGIEPPRRPQWVLPDYGPEWHALEPFLETCGLRQNGEVGGYVVVNPGATWATKRWPPERFGEVARGLVERHDLRIIAPWADETERAAAETIVRSAGRLAFVAPPTNLRQLAALISRARLFVGNDTGPLHLAVALGVPSVAVFGASDPLRNGPYGRGHRIQAGGPECQPCWKKNCPRGDDACLLWVEPEKVLVSCAELLEQGRAGA
jgi:heptosyltransferase-1